jgi:hypothetical protein
MQFFLPPEISLNFEECRDSVFVDKRFQPPRTILPGQARRKTYLNIHQSERKWKTIDCHPTSGMTTIV